MSRVIRGMIDRRILVNYRVDPAVLARSLPAPFRPKVHKGYGIAGVCLIRMRSVRPKFLPSWMGLSSENAAHRTAVQWEEEGEIREGVYVPRRDTSSRVSATVGSRVFPGIYSHARFDVQETPARFDVSVHSDDAAMEFAVAGEVAKEMPASSVFGTIGEASDFFKAGSLGYSATSERGKFQGLELRCDNWHVEPLSISAVRSSYFEDHERFPAGSITLDSALLMREIAHEWHGRSDLCCLETAGAALKPRLAEV